MTLNCRKNDSFHYKQKKKNADISDVYNFVYSVQTTFAYGKSIALELSNLKCDGKECQRAETSGRRINPEILPHLTGSINSIIMMLSIAEVAGRTR